MRVKLVSDGTYFGTQLITEDNIILNNVVYAKLELDARKQSSTLVLKMLDLDRKIITKYLELVDGKYFE